MNKMFLYNTLTNRKEELQKSRKPIKLFVCGPTVYDYSHLGHGRTYIAFDIFVRYSRSQGYKISYLQNITDIDDKIIKRAHEQGKPATAVARLFTKAYFDDMKKLGVTSVTKYAPATKFIPQIVKQVETLFKKGFAYKISDGYYFDISKFKEYGKLSKRTVLQAEDAVSRVDENAEKRNKGDFCLWKFYKPGEPSWNTRLGKGRPGWHIEDTAITEHFYGPQYDIHGGGIDLKFPHHEAEIAQQEAVSGKKPFVRIWMHAGFLLINNEKMSKSLGNFLTIRDFLKDHSALTLRYLVLLHHYRSPFNYTEAAIQQAENGLENLRLTLERLRFVERGGKVKKSFEVKDFIAASDREFYRAMDDDLNTPQALASLFKLTAPLQNKLWLLSKAQAKELSRFLSKKLELLGIAFSSSPTPLKARLLLKQREKFRTHQQFIQADTLRKKLAALGFTVEDTPLGPFLWRNNQI